MDIWHYDPDDGQLLGQGRADPDPMQPGSWLFPAWSTTIAPPSVEEGKRAHFNGTSWLVLTVETSDADA